MQDDARIRFRDLGHKIGLDESTTRRRFVRLRERGCVTVVTLVSAAALGFESEAILTIQVNPREITKAIKELLKHRSVRYLASMLNGNSLLCEVIAESSEELYSVTSDTLANLDGIMGWRASIELMTVKRGFIHTPWAKWLIAEEGVGLSPEPPSFQE
jgi:DNA-binding Lrp family transcriptional regulator